MFTDWFSSGSCAGSASGAVTAAVQPWALLDAYRYMCAPVKTRDHAVCCAGLAYAISCHLLQRTPTVLPGGTISDAELQQLAEVDTSAAGRFARQLFGFAQLRCLGPWHTLPDLLTFLGTPQFIPPHASMETWFLSYTPGMGLMQARQCRWRMWRRLTL